MIKYLFKILYRLNILTFLNVRIKKSINSHKFIIPINKNTGYAHLYLYDEWMITILERIKNISPGNFIDVGANIGQTLLKVKSTDFIGDYIGFEPNAHCLTYLEELISLNDFTKCLVIPVGIYPKNKILELFIHNDSDTDSTASIIPEYRTSDRVKHRKQVPVMNLNTLSQSIDLGEISILKIDVEGAEMEVLKEYKQNILKYRPIILLEILPVYRKDSTIRMNRQIEIEQLIAEYKYDIYQLILKDGKLLKVRRIDSVGINEDIDNCDYVLSPIEKKPLFEETLKDFLDISPS